MKRNGFKFNVTNKLFNERTDSFVQLHQFYIIIIILQIWRTCDVNKASENRVITFHKVFWRNSMEDYLCLCIKLNQEIT